MSFINIKGFLLGVLALFALAACEPAPTRSDSIKAASAACGGEFACAVAVIAADNINKERGRNYGAGVVLRGAKAVDKILVIGLDVPSRVTQIPVRNGKGPKTQIRDIVVRGTCRHAAMRQLLDAGGVLQLQTYLPSGKVFSNDKVRSC